MRAIILAAGEGKRLRPYTNNVPKSLVRIGDFTMLEYQLELFKKNNIECTVVAGYLSEKIEKITKNVIINENYASTNMLYTLFKYLTKSWFKAGAYINPMTGMPFSIKAIFTVNSFELST